MVSPALEGGKASFHTQVVAVFERPPGFDAPDVEAYGSEGVMEDVAQNQFSDAGEYAHMVQLLAHREAVTQNLEESDDTERPLAPLAVRKLGGDQTWVGHAGGSQVVDNPAHLLMLSK